MANKAPRFTRQHFEFIADVFGPLMTHPTQACDLADKLRVTNPNFNRDRFEARAVSAWEEVHADSIEDAIDQEQAMLDKEIKYATAI